MSLDESGRLVIDITTHAKFRGQFVMQHPQLEQHISRLLPPSHLETQFSLELLWSASTWEGPEQVATLFLINKPYNIKVNTKMNLN